jgi:carboxymethylenebutenolidase
MDLGIEKAARLDPDLQRRKFIGGSVAAGFALAAQPVAAQTVISTDTAGLVAGMVSVPAEDGPVPAYRAYPAANANAPVILVVQEIFGVHEHIRDVCRRLAKLGYYAIAPELYARQGDPTKVADIATVVKEIVAKVPDAQVMADLDSAVTFARSEGASADRIAITGFCWGGRIVWLYCAHSKAVKAGVAWSGRLVGTTDPLHPKNPIDLVASLNCPVLGLYGAADTGIPPATTEQMKQAADAAGKRTEFVVYPDTPHAFNADYRPSYREGPAKDGWQRLQAWFKANGV